MVFLKKDFNVLSLSILRGLCKKYKITYSKKNKNQLIEQLDIFFATKLIQKNFRIHFYKNAVDHITLEKVHYPCFIFRTKIGKCYFYNYESIIRYIMKTGNCNDPMTRIAYTDEQLIRLDSEVKQHFPNNNYKSTYKIKKSASYARRIRNRENEILSFHMRLDELKNNILFAIESDIFSWDIDAEPILIDNIEYPNINSYMNSILHELKLIIINLRHYDRDSAEHFKQSLIESISNSEILRKIQLI
jgi:hypothetical protein